MSEMEQALVFPVGHYAGKRPDLGDVHQVRRGWTPEKLTADEFAVWVLAHSSSGSGDRTDRTDRTDWTTADVLRLAESSEVTEPEQVIRTLVDRGLLGTVPLDPGTQVATRKFAQNHRMGSLLTGLGDSEENHGFFTIGMPETTATVTLDPEAYETWVWAPLSPTLWSFATAQAKVQTELGRSAKPTDTVGDVLRNLQVLLATSCAYLDLAFARTRE